MKSISEHIELLLVRHSCVIVPGFGTFVSQAEPARYMAEEGLFLPPYKSVAFNEQLSQNDGLLIHSYSNDSRCSYEEAERLIRQEVALVERQLMEDGEFDFDGIGIMYQHEDGRREFMPYESGILAPEYYGMGGLHIATLSEIKSNVMDEVRREHAPKQKPVKRKEKEERRYLELRMRRSWAYSIATVAAAALLFVLFLSPDNSHVSTLKHEASVVAGWFESLEMPSLEQIQWPEVSFGGKDAGSVETVPVAGKPSTREVVSKAQKTIRQSQLQAGTMPDAETEMAVNEAVATVVANTEAVEPEAPVKPFTLVLASMVSERNANTFIESLGKKDLTEARIYDNGKFRRVVYSGFATEAEAYNALMKLRAEHGEFAEAWVMEIAK